ncbi:MAG: nucleotidyltransferase [Desulfobacterales bacterium]|nr:nucleotidyltransferase [Desulfobacterales bacterium]
MDRNNVVNIISQFKAENLNRYGIKKIGIFGSVALNSASPPSDIDVVVELEKPDMFCLIGIKQDLEALLNMPVDIVRYRKSMNKYLKQRIDADAVYV